MKRSPTYISDSFATCNGFDGMTFLDNFCLGTKAALLFVLIVLVHSVKFVYVPVIFCLSLVIAPAVYIYFQARTCSSATLGQWKPVDTWYPRKWKHQAPTAAASPFGTT